MPGARGESFRKALVLEEMMERDGAGSLLWRIVGEENYDKAR